MEEAPGWAAPHTVAARWLFARGKLDQALVEIREAEQRQGGSAQKLLCEILARFPRMDHVERAAPTEDLRIDYLNRAFYCPGLSAEMRAQIDAAILKDEPSQAAAVLREARRLAAKKRSREAIALIQRALQHNADNTHLWVALIRAHLSGGDSEQAELASKEARSRGLESRALFEAQAHIEAALGQTDQMRATITRLRGQARGEPRLVAASFILEGELEASLGNIDEALAAYAAADVVRPDTPALRNAAALALRSGRPTHARRIYRALCMRQPGGPACAQEARLSKEPSLEPLRPPMP
jgi:tetratricopeptide (TPR) repeat protein